MKSRIFALFITFFLLGVALQNFIALEKQTALLLSGVFLVCLALVIKVRYIFILLGGLSFFFFGHYMSLSQYLRYLELNTIYSEQKEEIIAVVEEMPSKTEFGYILELEVIKVGRVDEIDKNIQILGYSKRELEFGDVVKFNEKISKYQPEKTNKLIRQKVVGEVYLNEFEKIGRNEKKSLKSVLFGFRGNLNEAIKRSLPTEEANLASGLILGEKAQISAETKRYLQAGGVSHIIALSGYNITILLGIFAFTKKRFSRIVNLLLPLSFILSFVIMTGGSASIVRAGIMGFMPILANFLYRPKDSFMAILFSAFIMVIFNPFVLLYDIGFQLSFAAMFGLCYLSPLIQKAFLDKENLVTNLLSETLGAQLAVLPLLIYYFGQVSLISPLSNLVILSLVPIGMFLSFLVGVLGMVYPFLGILFGLAAYVLLKIINLLIVFFGSFNFSSIQVKIENPLWILVMYLFLLNIYIFLQKKGSSARP